MKKYAMPLMTYERLSFNHVLTECFGYLYAHVYGVNVADSKDVALCEAMTAHAMEVFVKETNLENQSIRETIEKVNRDGSAFAKQMCIIAEAIAKDRVEALKAAEDDQINYDVTSLSDTEKEVVEKIFSERLPNDSVEDVRNIITNAIIAENDKADQIRKAIELDKKASTDGALSESAVKLAQRGPVTLLEAIYKFNAEAAIKDGISKGLDASSLLSENKEIIRDGSERTYAIYETINMFGFRRYETEDLKKLIKQFS